MIDEEIVMLNIIKSEYYGMDKVGSRIWELLEHPITFKQLIKHLIDEYDVNESQCISDTSSFLESLHNKDLLHIK